jgi:hypothetical protein
VIDDSREYLLKCAMKALRDAGVDDPEVDLFDAVLRNDLPLLKSALRRGADPNVRDARVIRRHFKRLTTPPVSEDLALAAVRLMGASRR